jgi:hypothetical protein
MSIDARMPQDDWDFWTQGLDRNFFNQVYRRSSAIGLIITIGLLVFEQKTFALGMASGLVVGLFTLWTAEVTVRLLFKSGAFAHLKLAIGALVKMPFGLTGLIGIAWAADRGFLNVFGVLLGVMLVHGAMLVMAIGKALASEGRQRERYR